jgi:hypothetical protein
VNAIVPRMAVSRAATIIKWGLRRENFGIAYVAPCPKQLFQFMPYRWKSFLNLTPNWTTKEVSSYK